MGRALNFAVEDSMIDACHRLRNRDGSGKPPGIIVKMVRRMDAEALLQKRRVKRNLNTHDIGLTTVPSEVVYMNESLSPARRRLLFAARQVKNEKAYTYLWVRGGKIFLRKDQGASVKVVLQMDDLKNLIQLGDGVLKQFLEDGKLLTPEERGELLQKNEGVTNAHKDLAQEGQSEAPDPSEPVNFHFIAFVCKDGHLYELDGRKSFPINHGASSPDTLLEDGVRVVREYMSRDPDDIRFTVTALTAAD